MATKTQADRIAELEEQLADAEAEAERWKPTADVTARVWTTADEVKAWFDHQHLKDIAAQELASMNSERLRRGFLPIDWTDEQWEQQIDRVANEMANEWRRHIKIDGPLGRRLKMVTPAKDRCERQPCYRHGNLVQIPVEDQINNQAGSRGDGINLYKDKGFKLAVDADGWMLCAAEGCFAVAAHDKASLTEAGYCSTEHRRRVEGGQGAAVTNVITSQQVGGRLR